MEHKILRFVILGERGKGESEGDFLPGANQEPDCEAQTGGGQGRVCREICPETTKRGFLNFSYTLCMIAYRFLLFAG